ncbi:sulfotransferase [Brevundimonas aurantiaca]|uniref:sulfotransferase n=1 Tax=Brevundimonas aurantiaca TaxID=74316 RepID=UPI001CD6AF6C|nr:sulfotransferase [Brevundimonas aurantiaca]
MLRYNPDVRFIFMLRHPTDRAWSHWRMNIRRGLDALPFDAAIRQGRTRVLEEGEHSGLARHSSYIERGYFGRQIAGLSTLFPLSNMLFLRQADLLRDPDAVLARVAAFLRIAPFGTVEPLRLNVGDTPEAAVMAPEDAALLDSLFSADLHNLEKLTGVRLERD